jgi:hypothetical protein
MPSEPAKDSNLTVIDTQRQRLKPPETLTEREAQIFRDIVDSSDPKHFRKAELPLLCAYVTAVNLSQWHALKLNEGDTNHHRPWLETTKLLALLASRLRLAPSTRLDKKSVERHGEHDNTKPPLWDQY